MNIHPIGTGLKPGGRGVKLSYGALCSPDKILNIFKN